MNQLSRMWLRQEASNFRHISEIMKGSLGDDRYVLLEVKVSIQNHTRKFLVWSQALTDRGVNKEWICCFKALGPTKGISALSSFSWKKSIFDVNNALDEVIYWLLTGIIWNIVLLNDRPKWDHIHIKQQWTKNWPLRDFTWNADFIWFKITNSIRERSSGKIGRNPIKNCAFKA